MNPLSALSFLISRPQQALFQGARAGSDRFGSALSGLSRAQVPASVGVPMAAVGSIPAFLGGAFRGLTGIGQDVSGTALAGGNPYLGIALDLTADPAALLGGVGARVPRVLKSFRNARRLTNPMQRAVWKNLGIRRFLTDIPKAPMKGEALLLEHRGLAPWLSRGAQRAAGVRNARVGIGGRYNELGDIIQVEAGSRPSLIAHEFGHRGVSRGPTDALREAMAMERQAPAGKVEGLRRLYGDLPIDEIAARAIEKKKITGQFPNLLEIQRQAWQNVPQRSAVTADRVASALWPITSLERGRRNMR